MPVIDLTEILRVSIYESVALTTTEVKQEARDARFLLVELTSRRVPNDSHISQ